HPEKLRQAKGACNLKSATNTRNLSHGSNCGADHYEGSRGNGQCEVHALQRQPRLKRNRDPQHDRMKHDDGKAAAISKEGEAMPEVFNKRSNFRKRDISHHQLHIRTKEKQERNCTRRYAYDIPRCMFHGRKFVSRFGGNLHSQKCPGENSDEHGGIEKSLNYDRGTRCAHGKSLSASQPKWTHKFTGPAEQENGRESHHCCCQY